MPQAREKVYAKLKELNFEFRVHTHLPIGSSRDAILLPPEVEGAKSKNLFLRNNDATNLFLVILELNFRVDLKKLANTLNEKRLSFASEDQLSKYLGVQAGSVSPFNLLNGYGKEVSLIIDRSLLLFEKLSFHPNDNRASIVISTLSFVKYLEWTGNKVFYVDF